MERSSEGFRARQRAVKGEALKRLFDLLLACAGLVLLAPAFVVIAIWVGVDSSGPVLFRQERVGRFGRIFTLHKFRTMAVGGEGGRDITVGNDARVTRVGVFLRRYKLDELPQLWDVVAGHMSLVGPRPELPRYVALYPAAVREEVLSVRPGITDLASIEFRNESEVLGGAVDPEMEYQKVVLPAKLFLAQRYVRERSLSLDFRLIIRTLGVVVTRAS